MRTLLVLFFSTCYLFTSAALSERPDSPIIDFSLYGIGKISFRILTYCAPDTISQDLTERLEKRVAEVLTEANMLLASRTPTEPNKSIPDNTANGAKYYSSPSESELIIRVYIIKHQPSNSYVFNVQTSLVRPVYTIQRPRQKIKAEVWRIDARPGAVDANNFESILISAVLGQVNTFIKTCKLANQFIHTDISTPTDTTVSSPMQTKGTSISVPSTYYYIASKNSRVFHRPDCPSARRIKPENFESYPTRQDAINAGKRPCKICKP